MNEIPNRRSRTSQISRSELIKPSMSRTTQPNLRNSIIRYSPQLSRALSQSQKVRKPIAENKINYQELLKPPDVYSKDPNFNKIPEIFETELDAKYPSHFRYPGFHGNSKMRPSPIHRPPVREIITRYDFSPSKEEIQKWKRISKSIEKQEKSFKTAKAKKAKNVFRIDLILGPSPPL